MNALEKILLSPVAHKYFWIGVYRRKGKKAVRVGFQGPMPPCHEFGKGNVGWVAGEGIRKVVADVTQDSQYSMCFLQTASELVEPIFFEGQLVGVIDVESDEKNFFTPERVEEIQELARVVAPLLAYTDGPGTEGDERLDRNLRLLQWIWNAREIEPKLCDWIGIYFKESFLRANQSTDLLLGPFVGLSTEHVRIPLSKGLCGLALREERIVNVLDVRKETQHIACNISTRSELVIPLRDVRRNIVAELDIDSDQLAAFTAPIEEQFLAHAETFAAVLQ